MNNPTAEAIEDYLRYEPDTGHFYWKRSEGKKIRVGERAGHVSRIDERISLHGKKYRASHLAIRLTTGEWPPHQVDHINGDPLDNRLVNLRAATQHQNMQNIRRHSRNRLGLLGVSRARDLFRARIAVDGKDVELGRYRTAEEAHEAYKEAKRKLHTFNPEVRQ